MLQAAGITVRSNDKGVSVEMTVDGAARLVQSLCSVQSRKPDTMLADMFLEQLIQVGKEARSKLNRS